MRFTVRVEHDNISAASDRRRRRGVLPSSIENILGKPKKEPHGEAPKDDPVQKFNHLRLLHFLRATGDGTLHTAT